MSTKELNDEPVERPEDATMEAVAAPVKIPGGEAAGDSSSATEAASASPSGASDASDTGESGGKGAETLNALVEQVESLVRSIEETNRLAQERERIIDRLHQENQQLRQGELQQAILPIFRDLIRLYDDLQQTALGYTSRAEVSAQQMSRDIECFAEMVTDILYRQGVERYEVREGESFNPKEHRVLGARPTSEQSKDRTIARRLRDGFRTDARPVRLLEAEVYRYTPEPVAPAIAQETSDDQAGE